MIIVKKVLILVNDEKNNEFILLGKGIGYNKKVVYIVEENVDTLQQFLPIDNEKRRNIFYLLNSIPVEIFDVTTKIFKYAQKNLNIEINDSLYYLLVDHLNFAIERLKKGYNITNRLEWEIKSFYSMEYKIAKECLNIINEDLKIKLPDEEIVNIAYHFINCQKENIIDKVKEVKLIGHIVNLVRFSISKNIDTEDIHYLRFITHIKFFVKRFFENKMLKGNSFKFSEINQKEYQNEYLIANRIKEYLYNEFKVLISDEEISFFVIHINRLLTS